MLMTVVEYIIAVPFIMSILLLPSIGALIAGSMIKDAYLELTSG